MFMIPIKIYNFHTEHRTSIHDFGKLVIAVARAFSLIHQLFWRKCYFSFLRLERNKVTLYADENGQGKMDKHKYKSITATAKSSRR